MQIVQGSMFCIIEYDQIQIIELISDYWQLLEYFMIAMVEWDRVSSSIMLDLGGVRNDSG